MTKIWKVIFDYKGYEEVEYFWENSQSSVDKYIKSMTKRGDIVFIKKELEREI